MGTLSVDINEQATMWGGHWETPKLQCGLNTMNRWPEEQDDENGGCGR